MLGDLRQHVLDVFLRVFVDVGDGLLDGPQHALEQLGVHVGGSVLHPQVMALGDLLVAALLGQGDPWLHQGGGVHHAALQRLEALVDRAGVHHVHLVPGDEALEQGQGVVVRPLVVLDADALVGELHGRVDRGVGEHVDALAHHRRALGPDGGPALAVVGPPHLSP